MLKAKEDAVERQLAALAEELEGYDERVVAEQEEGSGLGDGDLADEDDADDEVDAVVIHGDDIDGLQGWQWDQSAFPSRTKLVLLRC